MGRVRKTLIILVLLIGAATLVWAAAKLSGQANALAQDSGSNSAEMEMITMNAIRKPVKLKDTATPPPCDVRLERDLRRSLESNDANYRTLAVKAKNEFSSLGKISQPTRQALLASAAEFKSLSDRYAHMWDACGCITRAETARKTGETRMTSVLVLVSDTVESGNLLAMRKAQKAMKIARRNYAVKAVEGSEISSEDQEAIRANLVPRSERLIESLRSLLQRSQTQLRNLQSGTFGGGSSDGGGGGSDGGVEASYTPEVQQAITETTSVADTGRDMLDNATEMKNDVVALSGGPKVAPFTTFQLMGLPGATCFVDSSDD